MKSMPDFNDINYWERKFVYLPVSKCCASLAQKDDAATKYGD